MFAPVCCCFGVIFLLFASLFALSVHQALSPTPLTVTLFIKTFGVTISRVDCVYSWDFRDVWPCAIALLRYCIGLG